MELRLKSHIKIIVFWIAVLVFGLLILQSRADEMIQTSATATSQGAQFTTTMFDLQPG